MTERIWAGLYPIPQLRITLHSGPDNLQIGTVMCIMGLHTCNASAAMTIAATAFGTQVPGKQWWRIQLYSARESAYIGP